MPAVTAAAVLTGARVLSPVVTDLYKGAKGRVKEELQKWSASAAASRSLSKTLLKIESIRTLWSPDKDVLLRKFYYPSRLVCDGLSTSGDKESRVIGSLNDLPDGNIVIQGIVGQGKSIFMRYIAITCIEDTKNTRIPIFIELRILSAKIGLREAIRKRMESLDIKISDETFEYLADSGRIVLLLDGFDEISDDAVREAIHELEHYQIRHPNMRIIVSSRPDNEIQKLTGFSIHELCHLSNDDYRPFLDSLGAITFKKADLLRAITESPSNISGVIRTPLMMTLVVLVYEAEREIPPTLPEFFERLFQVVFSRHDRLKAGFVRKHYSGLSERRLQVLFEAFCFMALQSGYGRSLTNEQFSEVFATALEYCQGCDCDLEAFKKDITKVSCLMLDDGLDLTTFLHKSILEYYSAAFIKHSPDHIASMFYDSAIENFTQWQYVIPFLKDIDPYRFSRDYIVKEMPPFIEKLEAALDGKREVDLIRFIRSYHPTYGVGYSEVKHAGQSPEFHLRYLGSYDPPTTYSLVKFSDYLTTAAHEAAPSVISSELLADLAKGAKQAPFDTDRHGEIHLPFDVIIHHYGSDEFWEALRDYKMALNGELQNALNIISAQDKKVKIFDKSRLAK